MSEPNTVASKTLVRAVEDIRQSNESVLHYLSTGELTQEYLLNQIAFQSSVIDAIQFTVTTADDALGLAVKELRAVGTKLKNLNAAIEGKDQRIADLEEQVSDLNAEISRLTAPVVDHHARPQYHRANR